VLLPEGGWRGLCADIITVIALMGERVILVAVRYSPPSFPA
jgi:hypothetical protein